MKSSNSKARRASHAAKIAARSAQSSGAVRCYVEAFERPDGMPDLRLREKSTRRIIRVLSDDPVMHRITPLANLMGDCYSHGHGLTTPTGRDEHIAIAAPVVQQNAAEIHFWLDEFSVKVHLQTAAVVSPPTSVWCYIEEYSGSDGAIGLRLREKGTGRKVEMYGDNKQHLGRFLASPRIAGEQEGLSNLYEKDGYRDYVLVSGGTAINSYDVIRYNNDSSLTYLLGPTADTAYRDAFRVSADEPAAAAHARTATAHLHDGRYREAVLAARLAVETACGGGGIITKRRLAGAPSDVLDAANALQERRHVAVHESETRIEQQDAEIAVRSMNRLLLYLIPRI